MASTKTPSYRKEQMALTRSQQAAEIRARCLRATNLLIFVAWSGGEYLYTAGMISPEERELLVWLISFISISATRAGPPVGPWVEQEALVLRELLDAQWMLNAEASLPPLFRNLVNLFLTGQRTWGDSRLIRTMEERTSPRDVLMHAGFWLVEGASTFHMIGRGRVVETVTPVVPADPFVVDPPVLDWGHIYMASSSSNMANTTRTSQVTCPQYDTDGHQIESSAGNSPEPDTDDEDDDDDVEI